jgi:glycosyltransferase involved in cell wall biosynthesis
MAFCDIGILDGKKWIGVDMPANHKPVILLFADWFEPGYKAGGPIRSCLYFVQQMKAQYDIHVFTTDRDTDDTAPYKNVVVDKWIPFDDGVQIFYCSPALLNWKHIRKQVVAVKPHFVYLNSMFSRYCTIYPLLLKWRGLTDAKLVLSPRGMLKASALQFKPAKKKVFLSVFRLLGLPKHIHFHATDQTEWNDIRGQFGEGVNVTLAPNFPGVVEQYPGNLPKKAGELFMIFVGRLHPIKNLDYLLNLLPRVKGNISLTIVGSEEDKAYIAACKNIVESYPPGVGVTFTGEIPNKDLTHIIARHHIFALPTKGENFGHAIFEALAAGKPVLISDQTPWRNLEAMQAGWDLPLQQPAAFVAALQQAVDFNQQQYNTWSKAAWQHVKDLVAADSLRKKYYKLFS